MLALLLALLAAMAFSLYRWISEPEPHITFNCRLTLYVETPQGERVGSGVVQQLAEYARGANRDVLHQATGQVTLGEAMSVDLGKPGFIFVVLASDPKRYHPAPPVDTSSDPYLRLVLSLFPLDRFHGTWPAGKTAASEEENEREWTAYADELKRVQPQADVPLADLPMIVRFRNIDDPASIELVDPTDFAATLGAGVKLLRATLAITTDPMTRGIDETLPWLAHTDPSSSIGLPLYRMKPEQQLNILDFKNG